VKLPPALSPGDLVYITAPAKCIDESAVETAVNWLKQNGLSIRISPHCIGNHNYFSGTDEERLMDMQTALDDPEIKAIWCARGGYGSVRIIDQLNWETFDLHPKWLIGFSDITVFHQRLQQKGIASIHGTMPLNVAENTKESLGSLMNTMTGNPNSLEGQASDWNINGTAVGHVIGGNLSIVCSLIGTNDQPDYTGAILFLEDLAEHLYRVDRMFYSLKKSGILKQLVGVVIGGMTDMKDTSPPFGSSLEEIISHHLEPLNIPVAFDLPSGHINDNQAIVLGGKYNLSVSETGSKLSFDATKTP
jgi:muramoyltetrapeptide carboxypeptidase